MAVRASAALIAALASFHSAQATDQYAAAQTMIAPGIASRSHAVAKMIGRIISFTQWPQPLTSISLCVVGSTRFADRFGEIGAAAAAQVATQATAADALPGDCNVVYIGALAFEAHRRLLAAVHGKAILTIAEDDATCRGGAMFCLAVGPASLSFQISLDAISRGRVKIDPRVLRLSDAHGELQ